MCPGCQDVMLGREVSRKVPYMDRQTQIDARAQKSNVDCLASQCFGAEKF